MFTEFCRFGVFGGLHGGYRKKQWVVIEFGNSNSLSDLGLYRLTAATVPTEGNLFRLPTSVSSFNLPSDEHTADALWAGSTSIQQVRPHRSYAFTSLHVYDFTAAFSPSGIRLSDLWVEIPKDIRLCTFEALEVIQKSTLC